MDTKTYDPKQIYIVVGPHIVTGYAENSFVKVSREADSFSDYAGADGEVTRSRTRDQRGTIEVTLSQSSPSNDYLSALIVQDEQLGSGIVAVAVKDLNGTTLHSAGQCWVRKPADSEFGNAVGPRVWTIRAAKLAMFNGGAVV